MTKKEALNETLMKLASNPTTAETILAIDNLYQVAFAHGTVYGARTHAQAQEMISDAMMQRVAP